jgi:hypothetical protein
MTGLKQRRTFISYSRTNKDFALRLAKELRAAGINIWVDLLDIPTGSRWDDEVEKALEYCEIFMVILTPASITSENVKDEIGYAIDAGKYIVPVLLENAKVPLRLRRFQYVDFTTKSYKEGVETAKRLLKNLVEEQTVPRMEVPAQAQNVEEDHKTTESAAHLAEQKAEEERPAQAKAETDRKAKEEADRLAAQQKAETERLARQKAEEERLAQAKAETDRKAKEEADRLAAQQKAEAERLAKQKAEQERLAAQAQTDRKAKEEADRLAAQQKAEAERLARQKAEQERLAAQAKADRKAKEESNRLAALKKADEERLARQKAEEERLVQAKAETDRKAKAEAASLAALKKADEERLARQKAEEERLVQAKAETDRKAKAEAASLAALKKADEERLARQKAEEERLAQAKAEADRKAKAEAVSLAAQQKADEPQPAKANVEPGISSEMKGKSAPVTVTQKKAIPTKLVAGIAAIAILAIGGIVFGAVSNNRSNSPSTENPAAIDNAEEDPAPTSVKIGQVSTEADEASLSTASTEANQASLSEDISDTTATDETLVAEDPTKGSVCNTPVVEVRVSNLYLRTGPDIRFQGVAQYKSGNKFTLLGSYRDWFLAKAGDGNEGWLYKEWLKLPATLDLDAVCSVPLAKLPPTPGGQSANQQNNPSDPASSNAVCVPTYYAPCE